MKIVAILILILEGLKPKIELGKQFFRIQHIRIMKTNVFANFSSKMPPVLKMTYFLGFVTSLKYSGWYTNIAAEVHG